MTHEYVFSVFAWLVIFTHKVWDLYTFVVTSVLWRRWLGGRKGIWPVKTEWWDAGVVICVERDADLHMAQLMLLPLTVTCFSKIQIGLTFLVPAHPGSPRQRAVKWLLLLSYFNVRRQHAVEQTISSLLLFNELLSSLFNNFLQVVCILLHHAHYVVHYVDPTHT